MLKEQQNRKDHLKLLLSNIDKQFYRLGLRNHAQYDFPDFMGIGAPQAGSTWLHKNLSQHPDIFMARPKELHYFDRGERPSLKKYAQHFKNQTQKTKGEITPGYSVLSLNQIKFIRKIMPNVKLVYIVRNPVDQRLSAARRVFMKNNGLDITTVDSQAVFDFLENGKGKKGNYEKGLFRFQYAQIIKNWWSVFPKEQLMIRFFEEIKNEPQKMLEEILDFLGVRTKNLDWGQFPLRQKVNPNPKAPLPEKYTRFMQNLVKDEIEELYQLLGEPVNHWRIK